MSLTGRLTVSVLCMICSAAAGAESVRIPKTAFVDKCKGAWLGQMVGVCYGAPYEFRVKGRTLEGPLDWTPDRLKGAIDQDDCYVEMTFLAALEEHGADITYEQAGRAFGASKYRLWHGNRAGRANVRAGIMPPMSGHPLYNRHADDLDFEIESDLLGILCPAMPQESNRLCEIFGRIMAYGDGLYAGMVVAGMYSAAYTESKHVEKVVMAGLACIPKESRYHQCLGDVVAWHRENPQDWKVCWKKIEAKWQDDSDCTPGDPFNIDATVNGAYVIVGLLYGDMDLIKSMEIAVRCGQDSDCTPSTVAGVLGCMKGFAAMGPEFTSGLAEIQDTPFSYTKYSFQALIPACQHMTETLVKRSGGEITEDAMVIPLQLPQPPETLEQWIHQEAANAMPIATSEMRMWDPKHAWRVLACANDGNPGYITEENGRDHLLQLQPFKDKPAVIAAKMDVPSGGKPTLKIETSSHRNSGYMLRVLVDGTMVKEAHIRKSNWVTESVDMSAWAGKSVEVRIEASFIEGQRDRVFLYRVDLD